MVGSLGAPIYFKERSCLAIYMNILRRNTSTTCVTSSSSRSRRERRRFVERIMHHP